MTLVYNRKGLIWDKSTTKGFFSFWIGYGHNSVNYDIEFHIAQLTKESDIIIEPPSFCISPTTPQGFSHFEEYIVQHIDPFSYKELSIMNKWWISAVIYSDSWSKNLMEAQSNSFQTLSTHTKTSKNTSSLRTDFDHSRCIQDVMEASMPDRTVFVLWISAYGTGAMLDAFISAGLDLHESEDFRPPYLGCAARAHNLSTFQVLLRAGARTKNALRNFVGLDRASENDIDYINGLLQSDSPGGYQWAPLHDRLDEPFSFLVLYFIAKCRPYPVSTSQSVRMVVQKLVASAFATYSHPPYHRNYYLGPDVLRAVAYRHLSLLKYLIEMGASLDYVGCSRFNGYTALQTALELGYTDVLGTLLSSTTGYADRKSALLYAYPNTRSNLASRHPRRARGIDSEAWHGYRSDGINRSYWESYAGDRGASYETDLKCYNLIRNALEDLGVEAPFEFQEDRAGGDNTGDRKILSKCSILHKPLTTGCSRIQPIFCAVRIWR